MDPHSGNALIDGSPTGWFYGSFQSGSRHHPRVFLKYALHYAGEECKQPYKEVDKINITLLIDGGPFVHSFRDRGTKAQLPNVALEKPGDYVVYDPTVLHTWKAIERATVVTIQFPPPPAACAEPVSSITQSPKSTTP
jgi:hypothetical protein